MGGVALVGDHLARADQQGISRASDVRGRDREAPHGVEVIGRDDDFAGVGVADVERLPGFALEAQRRRGAKFDAQPSATQIGIAVSLIICGVSFPLRRLVRTR